MAMVEVGVVEVVVVEAVMDAVEDVERGRLRHRRRIGLEIVVRRWNMREVCVGEQCVCGCVECGVGVPVGGGEGLPGLYRLVSQGNVLAWIAWIQLDDF